jgi:hypothetical protein
MRYARFLLLGVVALGALVLAQAQADPSGTIDSFDFPLYDPANDGTVGPRAGTAVLEDGKFYAVSFSGTFSAWTGWTPEDACPPGASEGDPPTGSDPEYDFARPLPEGDPCIPDDFPRQTRHLELSTDSGATFRHIEPTLGPFNPDHSYTYLVLGEGFPVQVQWIDQPSSDNYGSFTVAVRGPCGGTTGTACAGDIMNAKITERMSSPATGGEVFFDETFYITFVDGTVWLSANADGTGQVHVDDQIIVDVVRPDGTAAAFTHAYHHNCQGGGISPSPPHDISGLLLPGTNQVRVRFQDVCGVWEGSSSYWLVMNDNCPAVYNPGQENADGDQWGDACDNCPSTSTPWFVPEGDGDCDGFTDAGEVFAETDPADACPDNPGDDAWPADMADLFGYGAGHHDGVTNIFDINELTPPYFGKCDPDPLYTVRKDFSGLTEYVPDGCINIFDIALLTPPMFGKSCTP